MNEEQINSLTPRHKEIFDQVQKISLNDGELIFTAFQSKDEETGKFEVTGFGEISDKMTLEMFKQAYEESEHFRDAIHKYIGERAIKFVETNLIPAGKKLFGMASDIISGIMEGLGNEEEEEEFKFNLNPNQIQFINLTGELYYKPSEEDLNGNLDILSVPIIELLDQIKEKHPDFEITINEMKDAFNYLEWPQSLGSNDLNMSVLLVPIK